MAPRMPGENSAAFFVLQLIAALRALTNRNGG
jgi:hypothetical protein